MDDQSRTTDEEQASDSTREPDTIDQGEVADEPVGPDNIRDGTVRGTMHGGSTKSEGQGQGG
jgi:hypothetical protein